MSDDLTAASAINTVTKLYRRLDERDYKGIAALFAPGGIWYRQGAALSGEAAILDAMGKRSPTLRIHHLLSNMIADIAEDGAAQVTGYMLVVRFDNGSPVTGPAPFSGVENIRTIRARLVPGQRGWHIQTADSDPISFAAP